MRKLLAFLGAVLVLCAAGCSYYDPVHPDTKSNRKLFTSLTGVKADKSIREVYVYADEFPYLDAHYCHTRSAPSLPPSTHPPSTARSGATRRLSR